MSSNFSLDTKRQTRDRCKVGRWPRWALARTSRPFRELAFPTSAPCPRTRLASPAPPHGRCVSPVRSPTQSSENSLHATKPQPFPQPCGASGARGTVRFGFPTKPSVPGPRFHGGGTRWTGNQVRTVHLRPLVGAAAAPARVRSGSANPARVFSGGPCTTVTGTILLQAHWPRPPERFSTGLTDAATPFREFLLGGHAGPPPPGLAG